MLLAVLAVRVASSGFADKVGWDERVAPSLMAVLIACVEASGTVDEVRPDEIVTPSFFNFSILLYDVINTPGLESLAAIWNSSR